MSRIKEWKIIKLTWLGQYLANERICKEMMHEICEGMLTGGIVVESNMTGLKFCEVRCIDNLTEETPGYRVILVEK